MLVHILAFVGGFSLGAALGVLGMSALMMGKVADLEDDLWQAREGRDTEIRASRMWPGPL